MEGIVALMIPIIAIILGNAMVVLVVYFIVQYANKRKQFEHDERMLAIEKGANIPIAPPKEKNPYIWPFVFMGAGLALFIGLLAAGDEWYWGLAFMLIGGGMLAARLLAAKQKKAKENENSTLLEKNEKGGNLNEV
ncbi:hypothetical protein K9N50_08315 [bacterium]|nr:hypothetical protein [bacterium]